MSALLVMALAILAAGYSVWPLLRGPPPPLPDQASPNAEAEAEALRAWSAWAGELAGKTGPGRRQEAAENLALDPEEAPK